LVTQGLELEIAGATPTAGGGEAAEGALGEVARRHPQLLRQGVDLRLEPGR
jgi:hypothetical protein